MSHPVSTVPVPDLSREIGNSVSDMVTGLQRMAARRAASRTARASHSASRPALVVDGHRGESTIPALSAGFAYLAWLG